MILSALLTSVGINLGLCVLFFTLYSILRKQPGNADVYAPRLVIEGKSPQRSDFNLERLLPSTSWVRRAWQTSEEELLSISGLDAVVFMRIFIFRFIYISQHLTYKFNLVLWYREIQDNWIFIIQCLRGPFSNLSLFVCFYVHLCILIWLVICDYFVFFLFGSLFSYFCWPLSKQIFTLLNQFSINLSFKLQLNRYQSSYWSHAQLPGTLIE